MAKWQGFFALGYLSLFVMKAQSTQGFKVVKVGFHFFGSEGWFFHGGLQPRFSFCRFKAVVRDNLT
jgi:hypothetical protein